MQLGRLANDSQAYWRSVTGLPPLESFLARGSIPPPPGLSQTVVRAPPPPGLSQTFVRAPPPPGLSQTVVRASPPPGLSQTSATTSAMSPEELAAEKAKVNAECKAIEENERLKKLNEIYWNQKIQELPKRKSCEDCFWDILISIPHDSSPVVRYLYHRNKCWDDKRKEKRCQENCICPIFICSECGN